MKHTKAFTPPFLKFLVAFLALLLLCLLPLQPALYRNCKNSVSVQADEIQNISVCGDPLEQPLIIEGALKRFTVSLRATYADAYEEAKVVFSLSQGGETVGSKTVLARTLSSGSYLLDDISGRLRPGEAILQIWGEDFPEDTDLYCRVGHSLTAGLPAARCGGEEQIGPMLLSYQVFRFDGYFAYYTVLLILLVLAAAGTALLLTMKREWLLEGNGLYPCAFVLIFLFVSLNNPAASFLGEPRSEVAYEFWYKAHTMGFWRSLMSLMSGEALAWTERILMWVADVLSPTKYVMMVAQVLQLLLICAVASMFSLKTFQKYFEPEFRLVVCFLLGTSTLFQSAYFFWAVSYWAPLFLIAFSFVDMDSLKRWQYGLGLAAAVILCVSRIYHVVFIPIAIGLLLLFWKKKGRRFTGYLLTVAAASFFEGLYSFLTGAGQHLSSEMLPIRTILGNTLYYQLQVLGSLLFGEQFQIPIVQNIVLLIGFAAVIGLFIWWGFFSHPRRTAWAGAIGGLGMLSIGTIMINVITCGMSQTVAFPTNYAAPVKWTQRYYQQGDLHFSYAYFAVIGILLVLLYALKEQFRERFSGLLFKGDAQPLFRLVRCVSTAGAVLAAVLFCGRSLLRGPLISQIETDWKSISYITERESYYASINVSYGVASISLTHHSHAVIWGTDAEGEGYFWASGSPEYTHDRLYQSADVGEAGDMENWPVIALTVRRAQLNFARPYIAVFYDREGNELLRLKQANDPKRIMTDFFPDTPIQGLYRVSFENEDGTPAYVSDALQFGIKDM